MTVDHLTADSTCRLTRSTRRPSSSSSTPAIRTRAPSTCRGGASSRPSFPCSPVRHLSGPVCRALACLEPKDACLRSPNHSLTTCHDVPRRSCTIDGVHEEGDLPQPDEERHRHGQHPRSRRQHCRALLHRVCSTHLVLPIHRLPHKSSPNSLESWCLTQYYLRHAGPAPWGHVPAVDHHPGHLRHYVRAGCRRLDRLPHDHRPLPRHLRVLPGLVRPGAPRPAHHCLHLHADPFLSHPSARRPPRLPPASNPLHA